MVTRSKVGISKPNVRYTNIALSSIPSKPQTVHSVLKHPGWIAAMHEELDPLAANRTWELVPHHPSMNAVGCEWVLKSKLHADWMLDQLKIYLVAKGFHQEKGIDFSKIFSLVIKLGSIRIVLIVATIRN